jgi:hypothetical protein
MAQRFKYRQLHATRDEAAVERLRQEFGGNAWSPRVRRRARAKAEREATQQVNADEAEATHDELVRQLRGGELTPSDLVFSNGAWTTFATAPEFYDVCAEGEEASESDHRRSIWLVTGVGAAMLLFVAWLLSH